MTTKKTASAMVLEQIEVTTRATSKNLFWVRWVWAEELPQYLVIANYPSAGDPRVMDVTRLLIMNHVREQKGGGVAIANLFSQPVTDLKETTLAGGASAQGIKEITNLGREVDEIILATGSLPVKSKLAKARTEELLEAFRAEGIADKLKLLVNPNTHKPAHPLSLQGREWLLEEYGQAGGASDQKEPLKVVSDQ